MLGIALAIQAIELTGWVAVWRRIKTARDQHTLTFGVSQRQKIPVVDTKLLQLAGSPTTLERNVGNRIIKLVRGIANTKAFEYVVLGMVNPRSGLRSHLNQPPKVVVF